MLYLELRRCSGLASARAIQSCPIPKQPSRASQPTFLPRMHRHKRQVRIKNTTHTGWAKYMGQSHLWLYLSLRKRSRIRAGFEKIKLQACMTTVWATLQILHHHHGSTQRPLLARLASIMAADRPCISPSVLAGMPTPDSLAHTRTHSSTSHTLVPMRLYAMHRPPGLHHRVQGKRR